MLSSAIWPYRLFIERNQQLWQYPGLSGDFHGATLDNSIRCDPFLAFGGKRCPGGGLSTMLSGDYFIYGYILRSLYSVPHHIPFLYIPFLHSFPYSPTYQVVFQDSSLFNFPVLLSLPSITLFSISTSSGDLSPLPFPCSIPYLAVYMDCS